MSEKQFVEECLTVSNNYRSAHQAPPLTYSHGLEQVAKQWADHLAKTNTWEHNPKAVYQGKILGENIASHWSSNQENYTAAHAVAQWYNEIERYDFRTHQGPRTGHFTQLVWRGSKELGVGRSQSKDGTWIAVANYFPPGNIVGDYPQNVLPPKDGKKPVILHDDGHPKQRMIFPTTAQQQQTVALPSPTPNKTVSSFRKAVRREVHGDVTTTTTTETTKGNDGVTTVKVTEKISRPGHGTKVTVTETITKPDGSKTTKTSESTEN